MLAKLNVKPPSPACLASLSNLASQPLRIMLLPSPIPETRHAVAICPGSEFCTSSMDTKTGTRAGHGGRAYGTDHCHAQAIVCRTLAMRYLTAVKARRTVTNNRKAESEQRHNGSLSTEPGDTRTVSLDRARFRSTYQLHKITCVYVKLHTIHVALFP